MSRDEAIEAAREFWRTSGDPDYRLRPETARYIDAAPRLPYHQVNLPAEPHWRVPLEFCRPGWVQIGASHEVLIFPRSGVIRFASWGE